MWRSGRWSVALGNVCARVYRNKASAITAMISIAGTTTGGTNHASIGVGAGVAGFCGSEDECGVSVIVCILSKGTSWLRAERQQDASRSLRPIYFLTTALFQSSIFLTQNNCVNHRAKRAWWANGSRRNRFGNKRFFVGARISDLRRNTPRLSGLVNAPERGPRSRRIIGGSSRCESARVMESDLKRTDYSVSIKNRARSVFMGCLSRNTAG